LPTTETPTDETVKLTAKTDPILAELWNNDKDEVYDRVSRGDVVLMSFIFSDESGAKLRPAVVVSSSEYHRGRKEAIIAA